MLDTVLNPEHFAWLLDASLKGSVLILALVAFTLIARDRIPPSWRHALWIVVLIRLLMPTAPSSPVSMFNLFGVDTDEPRVARWSSDSQSHPVAIDLLPSENAVTRALPESGTDPFSLVMLLWAAGAAVVIGRHAIATIRLHMALVRKGTMVMHDPRIRSTMNECERLSGTRRRLRVIETPSVTTPGLHGLIRPSLLIPAGLTDQLSVRELRFIFLHELAHLRRLDVAANWLMTIARAAHWFNPLVWYVANQIRLDRELACDEAALSILEPSDRHDYGMTIIRMIDNLQKPKLASALVGMASPKNELKRRLTMISRFSRPTRSIGSLLALLALIGFVSLTDAKAEPENFGQVLDRIIDVTATKVSPRDALTTVANIAGVNLELADDVKFNDEIRLNVEIDDVPARAALAALANSLKLGMVIEEDRVRIVPLRHKLAFKIKPDADGTPHLEGPTAETTIQEMHVSFGQVAGDSQFGEGSSEDAAHQKLAHYKAKKARENTWVTEDDAPSLAFGEWVDLSDGSEPHTATFDIAIETGSLEKGSVSGSHGVTFVEPEPGNGHKIVTEFADGRTVAGTIRIWIEKPQ